MRNPFKRRRAQLPPLKEGPYRTPAPDDGHPGAWRTDIARAADLANSIAHRPCTASGITNDPNCLCNQPAPEATTPAHATLDLPELPQTQQPTLLTTAETKPWRRP